MNSYQALHDCLRPHIRRDRLVETAVAMIGVPSPTGAAGAAADCMAALLEDDGFAVERPTGGYDAAPAVAVRWDSGKPGRTLQFDGHLDTVHLPFVPPMVAGDRLTGSGASDMKAGIAATIEALRALRDAQALPGGSVLLTAHDLHESPWGDGRQLDALIRDGYVGDAVLLPEPLCDNLPVVGRGIAVWKVAIRRPGPPIHEVLRPTGEPSVIRTAARLVVEIDLLDTNLRVLKPRAEGPGIHPGHASAFIGQIHAGEIYNQYPQVCRLEGTRRWLPGSDRHHVEREFRMLLARLAEDSRTEIECEWIFTRDAFSLNVDDPLVTAFQANYAGISEHDLPLGAKPFVDDGNSFWALAHVPAITHGPRAGGQHTTQEWVSIDDLERVALLYAATAVTYCAGRAG